MIGFLIWLICPFACASIAKKNGWNTVTWFLLGLIFGVLPIIFLFFTGDL